MPVGTLQEQPQGNVPETVGVRTITFSDSYTAEYVVALWELGECTEESLIDIMDEYGAEQGGGTLHIISAGDYVSEVDDWCFSPERQVGDYAVIENMFGYSW